MPHAGRAAGLGQRCGGDSGAAAAAEGGGGGRRSVRACCLFEADAVPLGAHARRAMRAMRRRRQGSCAKVARFTRPTS
jgi:hypothetical protein